MAKDINILPDAWTAFTGSTFAAAAAGQGMSFAMLTNANNREAALIYAQTRMGAVAPVAGSAIEVYLLRNDGTAGEGDDNAPDAGAALGAINFDQADLIFGFNIAATANKFYRKIFDTRPMGALGTKWTIGVRNGASQAISATAGDSSFKFMAYSRRVTP